MAAAAAGCSRDAPGRDAAADKGSHVAVAGSATPADSRDARAFWERSMRLPGIDTGPVDAARRMLVYFDPNCPVCAQQWQVLRPHLDTVRIHWIPIAYMSASSKQRAAAILAAANPAAALAENENGYDPGRREGGLPLPVTVPEWASRAVEENTRKAVRSENVMGTPTLAFELDRGNRHSRRIGLVDAPSLASAFGTTAPRVKAGSLPCVQGEDASRYMGTYSIASVDKYGGSLSSAKQVEARVGQPDAAHGIHASGVYADGVVAFESSSDEGVPVNVMLYRQSKSCRGTRIDSYPAEGALPVVEDVFAYPLNREPHLFVIVSWTIDHRGLGTRGKLYQVYAYGKDESGSMASNTGIAARNDMTGIEGTVSGKPSHFDGRTPAGVKKLVDGEEP